MNKTFFALKGIGLNRDFSKMTDEFKRRIKGFTVFFFKDTEKPKKT